MKKIVIYIALCCTLINKGCKDFLDLPPKNQRAVTTLDDVKSVLAGYLDMFARSNTSPIVGQAPIMNEAQNMMFEAYADNFDFAGNMGQYINPKTSTVSKNCMLISYFLTIWRPRIISGTTIML
ncbi:hypothetical protein KUH03_11160 [Sphingobacterium sp. E70]|uniref:hypothetical protein n=1 Tax=Sphingobacterium sp. E70 TaxID=2853439 RepID=UPI00211D1355|nr:hypothetical protein [Sphingobacterium sp. E70]ULT27258.1 hypothetical protein KUH03_11160 [Sphingobacterium sp. E70]